MRPTTNIRSNVKPKRQKDRMRFFITFERQGWEHHVQGDSGSTCEEEGPVIQQRENSKFLPHFRSSFQGKSKLEGRIPNIDENQ